jgi:ubiquinone/menaquinone biosynthesis C-methylase UbiE
MNNNNSVYSSENVVRDYEKADYLFPSEKKILEILSEGTGIKDMLDIGVGTGRTTKYFAPHFENYCGIDYSEMMIEACKKKFSDMPYSFKFADARDLSEFQNNSFDFVLFSFNGIDCVTIEERAKVLNEIKRVCRPDGWFAFSSHNIYNVRKLYSFQVPRNPFKYFAAYNRMKNVRILNPAIREVEKADLMLLTDGDLDFTASYVYIKPEYQEIILKENGFYDSKMFGEKGGEVNSEDFAGWKHQDAWIHYLCRNGK